MNVDTKTRGNEVMFLCDYSEKGEPTNAGLVTKSYSLQFIIIFFRVAPVAYRSSQARVLIRAAAADLCHSPSNTRSEPHLQPTPQLVAMSDP